MSPDDSELQQPEPDYDERGVDRTLIRACLRQTPLECLQALEELLQLGERVKRRGEPVPSTD